MQSDIDQFTNFIKTIRQTNVLSDAEIETALESLDGVDGVVSEEYFIFGYEELGWYLSNKLSFEEVKKFAERNHTLLLGHEGPRYYFVQALVDQTKFSKRERDILIECMPVQQQIFLKRRFL